MKEENLIPLLGLGLDELQALVEKFSQPKFVAKQLSEWLYKHKVKSIDDMSNLSKKFREDLKSYYQVGRYSPIQTQTSMDGTKKYLFKVGERSFIEAVYIPDGERATLCISSQVGCKMNCLFCQTGKQGFSKNLSSAEIINQVLSVPECDKLTNIVYMGMGEPLDNYVAVSKSIEILTSSWGLAWSPKRITLSTIGLSKNLKRFLDETKCHLAISVHNPISEERKEIMPIEKSSTIEQVMSLIRQYDFSAQRRMSVEYIVFDNLNDTSLHAKALIRLLDGIDCRINLIPFHQIGNVPLLPASREKMEQFQRQIERSGRVCTIRTSRGEDIDAACGMLSTKEKMKMA